MQVKIQRTGVTNDPKNLPDKLRTQKNAKGWGPVRLSAAYSVPPELANKHLHHTRTFISIHRAPNKPAKAPELKEQSDLRYNKNCAKASRSLVLQATSKPTLAGFLIIRTHMAIRNPRKASKLSSAVALIKRDNFDYLVETQS